MSQLLSVLFAPVVFFARIMWQTVFLALGQIWANKTQAVLTTLGIIIGVGGVILVLGGLSGLSGYVLKEFETFGARKMWVWGEVPRDQRSTMSNTDVRITLAEAELILNNAPSIDILTPLCYAGWDLANGEKLKRGVGVRGIWPEWHEIEDRRVIYGRPFSRIDNDERRQVCLVNETAVDELNLDTDPSGDYILLDGRRFLIVGLVETKEMGPLFGGGESRSEVFIPFATHKMMNPYSGTWLMLQLTDADKADDAAAEVIFLLRKHRQLDPDDENTFDMQVLQEAINELNGMATVMMLAGGFVASIALFVGGIGIMNIMLVSVSERTREIGLRKAVGAKPPIVLIQFLVEAVVLCIVGGLIGIVIGQGGTALMRGMVDWMSEARVPTWAIVAAVGVSAMVGIVSGMFPAIKAARLNPIDALRHE